MFPLIFSMVHVQKRISVGMEVIQFFTMRAWHFKSNNLENLISLQTPAEDEMFKFDSKNNGDEYEYLKNSFLGARQYCLKDPLSTLPKARIQLRMYDNLYSFLFIFSTKLLYFYRQYVVHVICKALFWYFAIRGFIKLVGLQEPVDEIFQYLKSSFIGSAPTIRV